MPLALQPLMVLGPCHHSYWNPNSIICMLSGVPLVNVDTCASASWSRCFILFRLVKLNMCVCTLLQGQMYFQQKHVFSNFTARWHKILEFVPSCPISGWLAWWCDFFPVVPTLEDHPQVFNQNKVQPFGFHFSHLRFGLFKSLFWLVNLNTCVCTPLQGQIYFQQKTCVLQFGRALTHFLNLSHHVLSTDDRVMRLFSCGASLWRSPTSRVQPLAFYFWHLRLGLFKSPFFWLVKLNMCVCTLLQSHVRNHTPSNNHGTFFPGVWRTYMF